jgi:phosphatidylinositol transfer protein SFH5
MSSDEKPTTAAPNNVSVPAETVVVPDSKESASEPAFATPAGTTAAGDSNQATTDAADTAKAKVADSTAEITDSRPPPEPIQQLWLIAKVHEHKEIWGVTLADPETHVPSQIVFQKFLNAYDGDLDKSKDTLSKTLDWRKSTKPLELLSKAHAKAKFDGLGYVTTYGTATPDSPEGKEVFTWNIYGCVKDINETFGDTSE